MRWFVLASALFCATSVSGNERPDRCPTLEEIRSVVSLSCNPTVICDLNGYRLCRTYVHHGRKREVCKPWSLTK